MNFARRTPRILLLIGLLVFSAFGTLSHAAENPLHQVKGALGGSVLLRANISLGVTVQKIEWDLVHPKSGKPYHFAEFRDGKLEQPDFSQEFKKHMNMISENMLRTEKNLSSWAERLARQGETSWKSQVLIRNMFGRRLGMADEATLRIKRLAMEDEGIYTARVWLNTTEFQHQNFRLTVYKPVPPRRIHRQDFKPFLGSRPPVPDMWKGKGYSGELSDLRIIAIVVACLLLVCAIARALSKCINDEQADAAPTMPEDNEVSLPLQYSMDPAMSPPKYEDLQFVSDTLATSDPQPDVDCSCTD
ncbi:uncharacterized protein LOC133374796 isoform X2 [Rhineura floridana]|uniref:uncharacterized protein LOC133374796 isoform X2 n=1 Tax=Rhineura floridana TaxID=261503 RepID=UPI002AC81836|nr:uncharacterized protein LOC133374796 isoform X2 [Rhineura floridana]